MKPNEAIATFAKETMEYNVFGNFVLTSHTIPSVTLLKDSPK